MVEQLAQLSEAIGGLREERLTALRATELTSALRDLETLSRQLDAVSRHLVGAITERGVAGEYGACSTASLLSELLLITARDAGARVTQAADLTPRAILTGDVLPPLFAATAAALDAGEISLAHARIITRTRSALPADVDTAHGEAAEALLVEQARHLTPTQLGHAATRLIDTLNPDGHLTEERDHERRRFFDLQVNTDGSSTPTGRFTPELTVLLHPLLDVLAAPQPAGELPDVRTAGQRRHDAIADVAARLLASGDLPEAGGCPVTVVVTVSEDSLRAAAAGQNVTVTDQHGTPLSLQTLASISAAVKFAGVAVTVSGGVLSYGQRRRLASCAQRRALAVRDKGCAFPGCTRPPSWTEAHHIHEWIRGGPTSLENLVLLCRYHHRHFDAAGWSVRMSPDHVPEWIPPDWIDPGRAPRRNTAHDCPPTPVPV